MSVIIYSSGNPELQLNFPGSDLKKINEMIKTEALKEAIEYEQNTGDEHDLGYIILKINYEIEYFSESYISITFQGDFYVKRTAHPTSLFYTLNIDLKNTKRIKLENMTNIDKSFVNHFRKVIKDRQKTKPCPAAYDYFADVTDKQLLEYLKSSDRLENHRGTFSYFTDKKICVVYTVPNPIGDYTVVEMDMEMFR